MISEKQTRQILFLTDNLGGGTGNHLLSMIKYWDTSYWQSKIISQAPLTARVSPNVPIKFLRSYGCFDQFPVAQLRHLFLLCRYVAENPPDIVHCYFFWPIIYGRLLKRLARIRFLVENREDEGFSWGRQAYSLLRLTREMPDRVICVSQAVRKVALEKEGLDPGRVCVVTNGVEPVVQSTRNRVALRHDLGVTEDNLVVGMVANFNRPVKGVSYFLDAIPLILQDVPSARFLLLGKGKEEQALRDKADALGIAPYIIFAGYQKEIERYYDIMDISVLTSLSEGLSMTLLESMSHGLPVVVTNVGGNSELVVDGQTGYLVPPKDVPFFAERVVRLLRNPDLRTRMGQEGRRIIKQRFQMQDAAKRYLEVYTDLLQTHNIRSSMAQFSSSPLNTSHE